MKAGEEGWRRSTLGFLFIGTFSFLLLLVTVLGGGAGVCFAAAVAAAGEGGKEGIGLAPTAGECGRSS